MKNIHQIAAAAFAAATLLATVMPAAAMPVARPALERAAPADVVQVRNCNRHDHHRRDHRFHGSDDYYDRDDQSGVLFKSFVTGTLFRAH